MSLEDEKIWEKPWTSEDLKTFSTSWSLAGDSGLLLGLKQLSDNFMSKSVAIEKKLQKLVQDAQVILKLIIFLLTNNLSTNFYLVIYSNATSN